jgi:hypothetical protein
MSYKRLSQTLSKYNSGKTPQLHSNWPVAVARLELLIEVLQFFFSFWVAV